MKKSFFVEQIKNKRAMIMFSFFLVILLSVSVNAVSCGDTITTDTILNSDLSCSGEGIIIGADNITLDLNGHKISFICPFDSSKNGWECYNDYYKTNVYLKQSEGVHLLSGVNGATIKNGYIDGFFDGIHGGGRSKYTTITKMTLSDCGQCIVLHSGTAIKITENIISSTGSYPIYLIAAIDSEISGNTLTGGVQNIIGGSNISVIKNNISDGYVGLLLFGSNNLIKDNIINNTSGNSISLHFISNSKIISNMLNLGGAEGIEFYENVNNNTIVKNTIANHRNRAGIWFTRSASYNKIYHNNFINNTKQVGGFSSGYFTGKGNVWDNGYPFGGNYWSDYSGEDFYSGSNQNDLGSDGIGDIPYEINTDNIDHYPLMTPRDLEGVIDSDGDGITDFIDNCPIVYNFFQLDLDNDGLGDACDAQTCANGIIEGNEDCDDSNVIDGDGCSASCQLEDNDGDGILDVNDACPFEDTKGQDANTDGCIDTI